MNDLEAMKEKKIYNYYAFVSYSHQDKKLAKKMQKWLESYRLPSALCKKYDHLPRKISPVFRDETDLTGTRVQDSLDRELDDSRYLIVLCSPNSAKSKYVNDEVNHFISLGREDYIIPVIVDGKPFSGEEQECFPPALRNIQPEILGISLQDLGMRNAFLKIVSTMLRIRPDELVRRDKRRQIVRNAVSAAVALLLAIAVSCTVWYNTEHSKYYNACIYRNEIPVGIYELSAAQRAVANNCFRITTLRGKVVRLEIVNSKGVPSTVPLVTFTDPDYPVKKFSYDSSGKLVAIDSFDGTGELVVSEKLLYTESSHQITIDYYMPDSDQIHALPSELTSFLNGDSLQSDKSEITRRVNTYDDNGLLIKSMFYKGNLGTPACDSTGVYGQAYAYNQMGQAECISNLNAAGEIHNCKYGWAEVEYRYNERGTMVFEKYLTEDGRVTRGEEGYSIGQVTCDENGNYIQCQLFDETEQLCNSKEGWAEVEYSYDEKGFCTSQKFFDVQGLPAYDKDGCHEMRLEYDKNGRLCGLSFWDTDSKLLYIQAFSGASVRHKLDDSGKRLERWWYDAQGNPTCNVEFGVYGVRWKYDKNGYMSTESYLDTQGKPMMSKKGYASCSCTYDQNGNPVRYEFYDVTGKLVRNKENSAILENTFDVFGNCTGARYFDEDGVPCYDDEGISSYEWCYEDGCLISEKYFDVNGQPMLCKDCYHEKQLDYDERGNCIREAYYDAEGNPVMSYTKAVSVIECDYNEYGTCTQRRYYDIDGKPSKVRNINSKTNKYDNRGNLIRVEYAGYGSLDYNSVEYEYDSLDNLICEEYFDEQGNPVRDNGFNARVAYTYDDRRKVIQEAYFDADGIPVNPGCIEEEKYNIVRYAYDDRGNQILKQYFNQNVDGSEVCILQKAYVYDEYGNCICTDTLDGKGNLKCNESGVARRVDEYSVKGEKIASEFCGEDGKPVSNEEGTFRCEYTYDVVGNIIERRFFGTDGEPRKESTGHWAKEVIQYDFRGNPEKLVLYNENDEPYGTEENSVNCMEFLHDKWGFEIGRIYYDKKGNVVSQMKYFVYIKDVEPGTSAETAGIMPGDILLRFGRWDYLYDSESDNAYDFRSIVSTHSKDDVLILCRIQENGSYLFYRVSGLSDYIGIKIRDDVQVTTSSLEGLMTAYQQWLEENPAYSLKR